MLKGVLGGSSHTFCLVTASLDEVHGDETLETMRFGPWSSVCGCDEPDTHSSLASFETLQTNFVARCVFTQPTRRLQN